jgi:hypothetical protein
MIGFPYLRFEEPGIGEIVIDTSASGLLLGIEETMAFNGIEFFKGTGSCCIPQFSNVEQSFLDHPGAKPYPYPDNGYLDYMFLDRKGMGKSNVTYKTCVNWGDPGPARRVIQNIHDAWLNRPELDLLDEPGTPVSKLRKNQPTL